MSDKKEKEKPKVRLSDGKIVYYTSFARVGKFDCNLDKATGVTNCESELKIEGIKTKGLSIGGINVKIDTDLLRKAGLMRYMSLKTVLKVIIMPSKIKLYDLSQFEIEQKKQIQKYNEDRVIEAGKTRMIEILNTGKEEGKVSLLRLMGLLVNYVIRNKQNTLWALNSVDYQKYFDYKTGVSEERPNVYSKPELTKILDEITNDDQFCLDHLMVFDPEHPELPLTFRYFISEEGEKRLEALEEMAQSMTEGYNSKEDSTDDSYDELKKSVIEIQKELMQAQQVGDESKVFRLNAELDKAMEKLNNAEAKEAIEEIKEDKKEVEPLQPEEPVKEKADDSIKDGANIDKTYAKKMDDLLGEDAPKEDKKAEKSSKAKKSKSKQKGKK